MCIQIEISHQTLVVNCRLILIVVVHVKYYSYTWQCTAGGEYVRTYIIGMMSLLGVVILVLVVLINRSAQGSITDTEARKHVPAILLVKLFLIIPETVLNVYGTMWAFCRDLVVCPYEGHFSRTVIEGTNPILFYSNFQVWNKLSYLYSLHFSQNFLFQRKFTRLLPSHFQTWPNLKLFHRCFVMLPQNLFTSSKFASPHPPHPPTHLS